MPRLHPPALDRELTAAERAEVARHVGLVEGMAKGFVRKGGELEDLVQAGTFGLFIAVRRYDPARKLKFETLAGWWIKHFMKMNVLDAKARIHVPTHAVQKVRDYHKAERALGPGCTFEEACDHAGIGKPKHREMVLRAMAATAIYNLKPDTRSVVEQPDSLADGTLFNLAFAPVCPGPSPADCAELADDLEALRRALDEMGDETRRLVLSLRFGLDGNGQHTLKAIGATLGLSHERVRQLEASALIELRERLTNPDAVPRCPDCGKPRYSLVNRCYACHPGGRAVPGAKARARADAQAVEALERLDADSFRRVVALVEARKGA